MAYARELPTQFDTWNEFYDAVIKHHAIANGRGGFELPPSFWWVVIESPRITLSDSCLAEKYIRRDELAFETRYVQDQTLQELRKAKAEEMFSERELMILYDAVRYGIGFAAPDDQQAYKDMAKKLDKKLYEAYQKRQREESVRVVRVDTRHR